MKKASEKYPRLAHDAYYGKFFESSANAIKMNELLYKRYPEYELAHKKCEIISKISEVVFYLRYLCLFYWFF
jgi:hypothetical protein